MTKSSMSRPLALFLFIALPTCLGCDRGVIADISKSVTVKRGETLDKFWNGLPETPTSFGTMKYGGGSGQYFFGVRFRDDSRIILSVDRSDIITESLPDDFPWSNSFELSTLPYGFEIAPSGKMEAKKTDL